MTPAQQEANRLLAQNPNHPAQVLADLLQRVSDAAKGNTICHDFHPFILPEPVDPLQEALREAYGAAAPEFVEATRAALAKRGLQIVPVQS